MGPDRGFQEGPAGDAEAHHGDPEAGPVDHLHHAVEPARVAGGDGAVGFPGPERVPESAVELDLTGGHAPGAELVLQSANRDGVAGPVVELAWYEVEAQPTGTVGRALGAREHDDGRAVDVRAEPLLAVDEHAAVAEVARGAVDRAAQVRSAVALGQEHGAVSATVEVGGAQPVEQPVAQVGRRVGIDESGDAARHPEAAHHAGVGLGQQVVGGGQHDRGRAASPSLLVGGEPRYVAGAPQRSLRIQRRGVVDDVADLVGPAVPPLEAGRRGVDDLGVAGDAPSD